MGYSGLSTLIVANERWADARMVPVTNIAASWAVSQVGILSAMLSCRQALLTGIGELKGRWVRWDHHTMGTWVGVCLDDPADLDAGTIELSCESMHRQLKKRRTGFDEAPEPAPVGTLALRAIASANVDRDIWIDRFRADEDGPWITRSWRGDDLFDVIDALAQESGYEYDVFLADDGLLEFDFRRQIGGDYRQTILVAEGYDIAGGQVQPSIADLVNDRLAVSSDEQWADSSRTIVEHPVSRDTYGRMQDTEQYDYATHPSALRTRAEQDLATLALPAISITIRIPDRRPVLKRIRHGDTIRLWIASKNRQYDFRVTSRAINVDDGMVTLAGTATEAA